MPQEEKKKTESEKTEKEVLQEACDAAFTKCIEESTANYEECLNMSLGDEKRVKECDAQYEQGYLSCIEIWRINTEVIEEITKESPERSSQGQERQKENGSSSEMRPVE